MVRYFRHGSSELREVGLRSKSLPTSAGAHRFCVAPQSLQPAAPWTISMATSRVASTSSFMVDQARPAGSIASSNGNATEAPMPCRNVRRGRCLPVMNSMISLS